MHPAEPIANTKDKVIFFLRVSARSHTIGIGSARISRSLTELHTALAISKRSVSKSASEMGLMSQTESWTIDAFSFSEYVPRDESENGFSFLFLMASHHWK